VRSKTFTPGGGCQPIAATANVTYTYDSAVSARGQLTGVASSDGSYTKTLTYNALGLLASTTLTMTGTSYTTQVGYDAYQRPSVTTQPSGEQVSVAYNSLGLTNQLDSLLPGATSAQHLVNGVTYDEAGRLTRIAFPAGGNLVRRQIYARFNQPDNDGGQLQSLQVQGPTSTLLNLGYHYDSYGNVKQSTDSPIGATSVQTATFTYDDQNRLLTAYNKTNAYDPAGRLTKYEDLPTTHNASFPVHAVK